jgi:hypothetical protein
MLQKESKTRVYPKSGCYAGATPQHLSEIRMLHPYLSSFGILRVVAPGAFIITRDAATVASKLHLSSLVILF